jgi:hypothetical protein
MNSRMKNPDIKPKQITLAAIYELIDVSDPYN